MNPVIDIQNIGKKYTRTETQPYLVLRDVISRNIISGNKRKEEFWALQNINLSIEAGESIGIIGRNGAGKSTLLKIISRVTAPTTGKILLKGRVAGLLEVGTGFHPELTGRENIYLNGSILGLRKKEMDTKLESIINFSGVEKFIDTPLKHFSTGMQLRLAFAVASHLEPEILLIDEVLAVGDMEFQKKCITKMEEVSQNSGRTIVFVSHNLAHLKQLCNKAVLLDGGLLKSTGRINDVISDYSQLVFSSKLHSWKAELVNKDYQLEQISIENGNGLISDFISPAANSFIRITAHAKKRIENSMIAVRFTNQDRIHVLTTTNSDFSLSREMIEAGQVSYKIPLPVDILTPGLYTLEVAWIIPHVEVLDSVTDSLSFEIQNDNYAGTVLQDGRQEVIHKTIRWEKC